MNYKGFVYYWHQSRPPEMWKSDLEELKANGMDYLLVGIPLQKRGILTNETSKVAFFQFLETAGERGLRCIVRAGLSQGFYLEPEVRQQKVDFVQMLAEQAEKYPAIYGIELEDEPKGRQELPEEAWQPFTREIEATLQRQNLTSIGYELALKRWKMEQYTHYVKDLVQAIKQVNPRLKVTICFNIAAAIPRWNLVDMEQVARYLDIVCIDVYPGWQLERYEHAYISAFMARLARSLIECEVWFVMGGHVIGNRYQPSHREIRAWSRQVLDQGVDALGWFAFDHGRWSEQYNVGGLPTKAASSERWNTMLEISRKTAAEQVKPVSASPYGILLPYDSILSRYDHQHFLVPYVALAPISGLDLHYVSDNKITEDPKALEGYTHLFSTPSPWMRKAVVERLLAFVKAGGTLIASSDDFAVNEDARVSESRKELLGILEEEPFYDEDTIEIVHDLEGLVAGTKLSSYWNRIRIKKLAEGSTVIGRWSDGTPAIFRRPLGKGQVIYSGTNPYWAALYPEEDRNWICFLKAISK
ncbi:MAG: hypothetical protein DRQ02_08805 [Candidatus Latescibacterota bacterium]|nr:MAG: hypothetical protein DRQ02_08805 [Candidatus Latescibacterota bacterium]RKY76703.1 MAG: hypothetical protein DRQ12_09560 [candidate division KSB1 bacterium]